MSKSHVSVPSFPCSVSASRSIFKAAKHQNSKFEITKKIAGGRNAVFLVHFPQDPKPYILKIYPHEADNKLCNRYLNESRFAEIEHPHIVKFFDCRPYFDYESKDISISSSSCILMEYEPAGDLGAYVLNQKKLLPDGLIRAWFHQLVDAVSFLHSSETYHLDIKLPNMLLSLSGELKLADFDISGKKSDNIKNYTRGTKNFRAPEIIDGTCENPSAADIYSLGISLFVIKTGGFTPYTEDLIDANFNLFDLMMTKSEDFWKLHRHNLGSVKSFFDEDFKDLFHSMTNIDPEYRLSIEGVKRMKWYNGPCFTKQEIAEYFKNSC